MLFRSIANFVLFLRARYADANVWFSGGSVQICFNGAIGGISIEAYEYGIDENPYDVIGDTGMTYTFDGHALLGKDFLNCLDEAVEHTRNNPRDRFIEYLAYFSVDDITDEMIFSTDHAEHVLRILSLTEEEREQRRIDLMRRMGLFDEGEE